MVDQAWCVKTVSHCEVSLELVSGSWVSELQTSLSRTLRKSADKLSNQPGSRESMQQTRYSGLRETSLCAPLNRLFIFAWVPADLVLNQISDHLW